MKRIVLSVCAAVAAAVVTRADTYFWNAKSGDWSTPGNWTVGEERTPATSAPGAEDDVFILAESGTITVTYKEAITVNSLEIGGAGGTAVLSSETIEPFQVTGDCTILTNGKVTHKAGDTKEPYKVVLMVGGDLTITEGGKVDVSGCGGSGAGRSNDNPYGYEVAAHGGEAADHRLNTRLCYGSVRYPFNYGSQGGYANGGGAAMLSVAGALRVDGSILAEPSTNSSRNGSGGSVWIEAGELLGGGVISAQALATGQGCGGGGRIAVKLTNAGADFSAPVWTGTITACGSLPLSSAAGTVYEQTGDQQDGFGTLYIDNGGLANTAGYTEFNGRVTDTDVGDVVIRGGARFRIWDDGALTVRGSIINEGTFVCKTGGSVTLDSAQDCLLKGGTFSISRLYCKVPGKTVKIADGTSLAIQNGGSLVLNGSAASPLTVIPENGASNWSLTLGSGVEQDVQYVAVKNAQASADVADFGGTDLTGNNDKWTFPEPVTPGATVTWTGATDTDWFKAGNWSPGHVPVKTDVVRISLAANGVYPICTQGKFTVNAIVVDAGATLTFAGTLPTVTNRLEVSGALVAKGGQEIVCLGDIDFRPGAAVDAPSATLRLTGPRARTLSFGDQSVYKVVAESDCGDITFATDFAATIFRNIPDWPARTLSFAPGTTCSVAGFIADGGAVGLTLASTAAGQAWTFAPKCFLYVSNATATDCGRTLENSGFVWNGGTGNFNAASGWSGNAVPGEDDCAFIPSGTVTLNDERTVGTVVVGGFGSSAAFTVPVEATAKYHLMLLEGATATCDQRFTIGGDVLVDSGATVTHQSGGSAEPYKVDFDVSGSMTVAAGGKIDVSAKGSNGSGYTTGDSGVGTGGYGGEPYNNRSRVCYGSVRQPFNYGSSGQNGPAGGAAKLVVAGELAVYGQILSWPVDNQRNGSGGSIWLTAGTFRGDGIISANARKGTGGQQFCGAGGRVAVKLTEAGATFAAWSGKITAYGDNYNGNYASCGTVYQQTGDQRDGYGTLYVDGGSLATLAKQYGYVDFNDKVTDADVGDVVVRGNGRLRISDGGVLTVRGSITIDPSHGTFTSEPGGELVLDSMNDCVVSGGTLTLSTLRCKVPGKTVRMATGTSLTVLDGGTVDLTGSEAELLTLVPAETSTWNLTLGAGVTKTVEYVAVSNSVANVDITDVGGVDLGGNSATWSFVKPIKPGTVITWTGAAGTPVWEAKDNWDLGRAPVESDVAVIAVTGGGNYPVLEQGEFAINTIRIDAGATLTFAGTLPTVTNFLEVSGSLVVRGAQDVRCQGDVDFKPGAAVRAPSAVFLLTGSRAKTLDFGDQPVYKVVAAADCGDVTFAAGLSAELVRNIPGAAARTLSFAPGTTCAVTGFIADGGAVGLTLASTAAGQAWTLSPKCFLYVSNATATDCGRTLENSGFVWKGGTGNFNAASGWSGNAVPGGDDCAFIPSGTVTLNDERTVGTVVVGGFGSSAAFSVPVEATAKHHLMLLEGATATCDKHFTIGGDVLVDSGATVTHQSGGSAEPYKVDFDVAGSMTVAAGGKVDVSGCGGSGKGYSSDSPYGYDVAAYGGEAANHKVNTRLCYGSVRKPFNYGTSGHYCKGGGAAKVFVAGALTVNGSILAEPSTAKDRNGSGGSVWIEAGELRGSGVISAQALPSAGQGCGGGGRVAVKLTKKGAGFTTDWTGEIKACGSLPLNSAAGTIYEQTGDQQDGFGTLYVDNFGLANTAGYTEINGRVTETDVGDVVIRGGARFRIFDDGTLTVRGSIVNAGTFTCNPGAAVTLDSPNDCNLSGGTLTLSTLRCRVPGKTVRVATGTTLKIIDGGTLDLMGTKQEPLTLVPVEAASTWNLTLGAGVVQTVEYVAVSNSVANVDVTDVGGTDLGGNSEQWTFIKPIEPGTAITWTGAAGTSDWTAKGNWDLGRAPVDTDVAVINVAQGGNYPVLEMGEFSINTIQVKENASLTFAGALPTVTNLLEVTGTLVVKGRQKVFCRGDLVFKPGATYVSEGSAATFVLTGAGTKHVTLNGQRLHGVLIESDAGDVAFMNSAAVRLLRNVPGAAARTIALAANSTLTVDGLVADGGAAGLTLTGESWHLATKYFAYVKNATASGCDRPLETSGFVWNGGTADFGTASNWGGTVPGADDCAFIPSGTVTVGGAGRTVGTLVVGGQGSSSAVTVSAPLTVADDFCLADGATVTSDKPVTVGGDLVIYDGATVKQSAETYMEYAVAGQAEVCYAGQIDGRGAGNVTTGRAQSGDQTVACYGGLGVYNTGIVADWKCYGSIANPTNLGSAGHYANGGGRLRLVTTGELRVDGTISCNPTLLVVRDRAGSGGSVWITCAKLTGTGRIEADGEDGQFGEGGGRLAIEQKAAANFSAFKGVAEARDRSSRGGAGTVCLTGAGTDPQVVIADVLTGTSKVQTYTQLPGYTGADTPKQLKKMGFVVRDGARVRLMADMTIRDLDLQTKNVELDLNGHTLTILSQRHKRGLGWAKGATVTSMENIVWRPGGFVISIR